MMVQSLSAQLVRKSTQLTVHQEHPDKAIPLDIHSSREIDQRTRAFLVTGSPAHNFGFNAGIVR